MAKRIDFAIKRVIRKKNNWNIDTRIERELKMQSKSPILWTTTEGKTAKLNKFCLISLHYGGLSKNA